MIKDFFKDRLLIAKVRNRMSGAVQIGQRQLYHYYRDHALAGTLPPITDAGFRVFSQFEEDGKLLYLFAALGMDCKRFVEIGADDGVNSNSANLYFNFGWHGLFVDANPKSIARGQKFYAKYPHPWFYTPDFVEAMVSPENINQILTDAGYSGEVGLLSIDIDGHDYWVWDAMDVISPQVVIIETHNEFGKENIVVPYDPDYVYPGKHPIYHGASPVAMTKLAHQKGYRLVGANELGFNFIYLRDDLLVDLVPEVSVESVLQHVSQAEGQAQFEEIRDWEYFRPE